MFLAALCSIILSVCALGPYTSNNLKYRLTSSCLRSPIVGIMPVETGSMANQNLVRRLTLAYWPITYVILTQYLLTGGLIKLNLERHLNIGMYLRSPRLVEIPQSFIHESRLRRMGEHGIDVDVAMAADIFERENLQGAL